jgi:hypothetical protein
MGFTFKYLQKIDTSKYDILISTSLFMMKCPYKNFKQYYIEPFYKWIVKIPKNSYVRLYVDESIIDKLEFKELYDKKISNLEIVFYQFDDFYINDTAYDGSICPKYEKYTTEKASGYTGHDGTFGSIVRLLPLYSEFRPQNIKYVWISDIDLAFKAFNFKYINNLKKNKAFVSFFSKSCYDKPWVDIEIKYPIFGNRIIMDTKVKLNKKDFFDFLKDVRGNKYQNVYDEIAIYYKNKDREVKDVKWFPVGFDELFINKYLQPVFLKFKRIIYFDISLSLFRNYLSKEEKKEFNRLFELCQELKQPVPIKARERYIQMNKELYQKIKNIDFREIEDIKPEDIKKFNYCRRDFEENYKIFDLTEIGATAVLIKNSNKE